MGIFDFLTSTKRPKDGAERVSSQELKQRLLGLNRPSAPFRVIDGASKGVDLIAEWSVVDAKWLEVFSAASLTKTFEIYLKIDEASGELRAQDHELSVEWVAGAPKLSVSASAFKGQKQTVEFGAAYGFIETAPNGQIYKYRFNSKELKAPIQEIATAAGWTYKGVSFGSL